MKINSQTNYLYTGINKSKFGKEFSNGNLSGFSGIKNYSLMSYPSNYYLSFGARVDKGLNRFYEKNKDLMPATMKEYIDNLSEEEKNGLTPLSAQQNAFEYLSICDNIDDVKYIYPNEPLFADLKSCFDVRTRQGFLNDVQVIYDDIKQENGKILSSGEDLTLYIIKKIFLEGKTTNEINEDLDNDIHEILKREDKDYISPYTCKVLGIKLPQNEYLTSLRYTREGYSDEAARKITAAWERQSDEEKERRISYLLSSQKNISPEQKEKLKKQRSDFMKKRWQKMSNAEKTAYIEKLKAGGQEQSIIMVSAWNKCPQARKDLSSFLREADFHNTEKIIYSDKPLSAAMSIVMTEFWEKNPEHAETLGEAIIKTRNEIEDAKENGNYDKYIEETLETSKKIKAEIKAQANIEMKTKRREKNTNPQVVSEPAPEENSDVAEISFLLAQQMMLAALREKEPYFPEKYLSELSLILTKEMIDPEYDITQDKINLNSMEAYYAVLNSLFLCTDDNKTKAFLASSGIDDIEEICRQIHSGNMNPVIKGKVRCFSKQPDQNITDKKYESYIKPLTNIELKKIKQICQNWIKEDYLKPQNGYLREFLNDETSKYDITVRTNMIMYNANPKFVNTLLENPTLGKNILKHINSAEFC